MERSNADDGVDQERTTKSTEMCEVCSGCPHLDLRGTLLLLLSQPLRKAGGGSEREVLVKKKEPLLCQRLSSSCSKDQSLIMTPASGRITRSVLYFLPQVSSAKLLLNRMQQRKFMIPGNYLFFSYLSISIFILSLVIARR